MRLYQRRFLRPSRFSSAFFMLQFFAFAPFQISVIFQSLRTARRKNRRPFCREAESKLREHSLFQCCAGSHRSCKYWLASEVAAKPAGDTNFIAVVSFFCQQCKCCVPNIISDVEFDQKKSQMLRRLLQIARFSFTSSCFSSV